jgi:hypothetical protein
MNHIDRNNKPKTPNFILPTEILLCVLHTNFGKSIIFLGRHLIKAYLACLDFFHRFVFNIKVSEKTKIKPWYIYNLKHTAKI